MLIHEILFQAPIRAPRILEKLLTIKYLLINTVVPTTFQNSAMSTMCSVSTPTRVAVCQFTATEDKEHNLNIVKKLVHQAAIDKKAQVVFLPEACDYISTGKENSLELCEPLSGTLVSEYKNLARDNNVWLSVGGFHEKVDETMVYNSHLLIDSEGCIQQIYRKIHLFNAFIPGKNINLRESDLVLSGSQIFNPVKSPIGQLALAICYDLRFPELSILQTKLGAEILTYPSAFTYGTGKAHWEVLLRARAIENQCFVIAAAQYGRHNDKRTSYGQSMIIDPWGKILAQCPIYDKKRETDESIAVADIDLNSLDRIRCEMPVSTHRRNDIYNLNRSEKCQEIGNENYFFADKIIPASTVFYRSKYCFAFTNIRCVVPGHILISTLRLARKLADLSQEELADLMQTCVTIQKIMETVHSTDSSTICVQDGAMAGQTVPHVHMHILPRKQGDFENNDDIYSCLAHHDKPENKCPLRTLEEQTEEAMKLRKYFS